MKGGDFLGSPSFCITGDKNGEEENGKLQNIGTV